MRLLKVLSGRQLLSYPMRFSSNGNIKDTRASVKTETDSNKSDGGNKSAKEIEKQSEINGPKGPEPTRYGDWERKGRCIDF